MTLDKYWQKRDFKKTPEPRGTLVKPGKKLAFYIQRHHASHLHYDFRLELEGTLKSWAVPKGPSLDPADKRLAMHVEDHPLSYGTFEGEIPPKQYGAGTVIVWDKGVWIPDGDPVQGLRKGSLKFELKGEKLAGHWALVRMGPAKDAKESWLLIKERDAHARSGEEANITALRPESVISGAGRKSARARHTPADQPDAAAKTPAARSRAKAKQNPLPDKISGAVKKAMPDMIKPQLATLIDKAPAGDEWLAEVKFDGYRAVCRIDGGKANLFTRAGNDWTTQWKVLAAAAAQLPVQQAWLDGEVVAIGDDGAISFQLLQNMAREGTRARLAYYVFDLLYLNGQDLRQLPLLERKQLLKTLLASADPQGPLLFSDHIQGDSAATFSHACMHALEGIIVKRADAPYLEGRSRSWLKVKCQQRQEFVIGGYTEPNGSREKFGALLLGIHEDGKLRYAGRVGTGFDDAGLKSLFKELSKYPAKTAPFSNPPTGSEARGVHWLKPKLVAEVKFAQWTGAGSIRHASFVGLRSDKPPQEIRRELPLPVAEAAPESAPQSAPAMGKRAAKAGVKASGGDASVAGVRISHPSKVLFAENGLTKLQLAQYYEQISDWILPHLTGRPLTLVRCPNGGGAKCFFQKNANDTTASDLTRIEVPDKEGTATYMTADSVEALVSLVQMGVLELHTWGAGRGHLDRPDRIIFDLDPAPDVSWTQVIEAARLTRGLLEEIGLTSFLKTTGGKGLHVVAPIKPDRPWAEIKAFSKAIAEHLAGILPDRFTAKMTKATRTGKIFIDYLRNAAEATAVAAYSTRARPGAPVSVPIAWNELNEELRSDSFNVFNLPQRLATLKQDPWHDYFSMNQRITAKMLRTFNL
jgi:bifunctional non-homologous end joining protein LigD